jgi:uncharacterized membrane protein YheB (UPF0754 family)
LSRGQSWNSSPSAPLLALVIQKIILALLGQLVKQLGELDQVIRHRVSAFSVKQLEALDEPLLDFSSATDLVVW